MRFIQQRKEFKGKE